MQSNVTRAVVAGLIGTLVMTAVGVYAAPMMGMPPMNPAAMLAGRMGGIALLGWAAHLMIGVVLALVYATLVHGRLPGPGAVQGATYSLAPWLLAQLVVMPMMGMPIFSGSALMAGGSLVGHFAYGAVLGGIVGTAPARHLTAETAH